jgi:CubicO group peptidase (beta-lactamase class C family)
MQLVEQGLIRLDDDVGKIIPQLSNMDIIKGFDDDGGPIMAKQSKAITLRYGKNYTLSLPADI